MFSIFSLSALGAAIPVDPTEAARWAGLFWVGPVQALASTLLIFGFFALFAYLFGTRVGGGGVALAALVLSVLGTCMVLSVSGLYTYGIPLLAQEYVNGQQDALQMATAITGGKIYAVLFPSVFLYVVSFVLFGIAVWRSELLPKWAGALLALAGLLVLAPPPTVIALLGNILLIVAGGWIALGVLGRRSAGAA